jgi:RHS repeat-associated protein
VITRTGGGSDTFVYSYGGSLVARRTAAADGGVTEVLSPDRLVRVEDGQVVVQFSDGERIVARERAGQRLWLHHDHLGSLVMATDATATPVLTLSYDPFGQVLTRNGAAVLPDGFATGTADELGLVLLGARWYCPRLARFISPDPLIGDLDDPAAWNVYAYCRNNPTSYIDPSGRSFWKIFAAVVATVAIIALAVIVTVCTFGIGTPGAVALTVGGLSVTWGAVFAATVVGIVAGGVIGGIAAARAGGDAGDVFLGVVVGGAVGGWAAFGAAFAGVAVGGALGLTSGTVLCGAVVGGVSGAINGAAMGFAAGFAGGKNRGIGDIMAKVLVGAIVGAALGAALGALSGFTAPKQSLGDAARQALRPDPAAGGAAPSAIPPGPGPTPPAPEINTVGGALNQIGTAAAGKAAGVVLPYAAAATAGITGNIITQTIVVDVAASSTAAFFDDLQEYVRTHNVDLGPFNFIKGSF